jgi:ABC-type phosphate/phosphonate transport system ATPase subunit
MQRQCASNMDGDHVIQFARVDFRNDDRVFGIKHEDRFSHVYVIGKTGTGKSTLLETMATPRHGMRKWIRPH